MIVGIRNISKIPNYLIVNSFSMWVSGFSENKLAGHEKSKIGRILRGNTFGIHYGVGYLAGKPYRRNKIIGLGINAQKYIDVNYDYINNSNPDDYEVAYYTKFSIGVFTFLTFII